PPGIWGAAETIAALLSSAALIPGPALSGIREGRRLLGKAGANRLELVRGADQAGVHVRLEPQRLLRGRCPRLVEQPLGVADRVRRPRGDLAGELLRGGQGVR